MLACEDSAVECICNDPSLRIHVPAARAGAVTTIALGGPACAGVHVSCTSDSSSGGDTVCSFRASAAGRCHVDVDFSAGAPRFSADAQIVAGDACCGGFYADPISAGDIEVPGETAEAGGAG
jgi:hypothetical protein